MDPQPDLAHLLPRDAYRHLVYTLRTSLPPPAIDSPEHLDRRDNAAIAQVASLLPANASEATLAAQYVAAHAQAMDSLRLTRDPAMDPIFALKCRSQAASMMRQAQGAMRLLLRLQATRQAVEADEASAGKAAWTEHCAIGLMTHPPPAPRLPEAIPPPQSSATPDPDAAEAEAYAIHYPRRAALIRRLGRLPDNPPFGPPEDHLVRALVNGRTPTLLALDHPAEPCAA